MGVAVSGMHYTGMAALTITGTPGVPRSGTSAVDLLGPLILGIAALTAWSLSYVWWGLRLRRGTTSRPRSQTVDASAA